MCGASLGYHGTFLLEIISNTRFALVAVWHPSTLWYLSILLSAESTGEIV